MGNLLLPIVGGGIDGKVDGFLFQALDNHPKHIINIINFYFMWLLQIVHFKGILKVFQLI
jgi:hypothetical protein